MNRSQQASADGQNDNLSLEEQQKLKEYQELFKSLEKAFDFEAPEGFIASFSQPVIFATTPEVMECDKLAYQANEPTMKEIFAAAKSQRVCGPIAAKFCIKLNMEGSTQSVHTESPSLNLTIPCEGQSFVGLGIAIENGAAETRKDFVDITVNALISVSEVYLTNSSDCSTGRAWQELSEDKLEWKLSWNEPKTEASVYAKFRDILGYESGCVSDSIAYQVASAQGSDRIAATNLSQCFADEADFLSENLRHGLKVGNISGSAAPYCTSDGQKNCIATEEYKADASSSFPAKVIKGNNVGGEPGGKRAPVTNCSRDGELDCASGSNYPAALSTGLAAKVIVGNTVAGVAGTAIEAHPNCTAANQDECIATATYKTIDLSAKDSGGAIDITAGLFSARIKSSSTFEFWDDTGTRYTAAGDADIVEANVLDSTEIFGVTGTAGAAPDCSAIGVGGTWILVPGDTNYGTNDFCVMKYEAKCSLADGSTCTASASSESPTSTAANTPWVSIDQQDAKTECASLGKGYHLITNDEWMTIATNVAAQGANWDGGTVGTNEMARGHSDNNPASACEADASDANAYVETNCATRSSSGTFNQRRTHTLSNGEVIWDLAGNIWEWTSYFNDEEKPTPNATAWYQYTQPIVGTTTMPLTDLIPQVAIDNTWNSTESIGQYYPGNDASGGALRRGGRWVNAANAGVFTAILNNSPTGTGSNVGFRCAVAVP